MTTPSSFERSLIDWLEEAGAPQQPDYVDEMLAHARRTRQRPAWASLERWLPMQLVIPRRAAAVPGFTWLLLIAILIAVFMAVVIGAGSHRLPPLIGPAGNGLIALDQDARISIGPPDGTTIQVLTPVTEVDIVPVWSPNGMHLAFYSFPVRADATSCGSLPPPPPLCDSPNRPIGSLVVMKVDGTDRRVLVTGARFAAGIPGPVAWSHDGTRIALTYLENDQSAIEVLQLDGTRLFHLAGAMTPTWSPDDTQLAFGQNGTGVFVARVDGSDLPVKVSHAIGEGFAFMSPQWSPDGKRIAFYAGSDGSHDIYTVRVDGTDERLVSGDRRDEYWPIWSPDGTKLAFQRDTDLQNDDHFVVGSGDGSNLQELQTDPIAAGPFTWSPDGRFLIGLAVKADLSGVDHMLLVDVVAPERSLTIATTANMSWQRIAP